jgi:hypothetical protein
MCEGICVWVRQMHLPECERSPTVLAHEVARTQRMASFFEERVLDRPMQGAPRMAHQSWRSLSISLARGASAISRLADHNSPPG